MPLIAPDNRVYLGVGGGGKSTLARHHSHEFRRVLWCDPNCEPAAEEDAVVTDSPAELAELLRDVYVDVRVVWRGFLRMSPQDAFDWACEVAWERGNVALVMDEADMFMNPAHMPKMLYRAWNAGRHRDVRCFAISRRPNALARGITANTTRACVFRLQEPRDLAFLSDFMGRDAAGAVPGLPDYHAVDWTPAGWSVKAAPYT